MYAKILQQVLLACLLLLLGSTATINAQTSQPFTGKNIITVVLESPGGRYEFQSHELLVRYNRSTEQLECSVLINSLRPLNDTIPSNMAYDVLYGARLPELDFLIDVPKDMISSTRTFGEPQNQRTTITLQGNTNQLKIPVVFATDKNTMSFGTNFELMLDSFEASVPARYLPVLTGRLLININNARWVEQP
ncbi:hypothetical protein [Pontibacter burrus]|uniref:Lipid/polyisoprenoid-binding YceI-like domain-containing protein n=1 Tax=Pontibacter burrus TaxID=2704466 RepID=A0A6B3LS13_9BACT|nr:hypothetical protein [Pontibacter burrus]NEM97825.1 hypothetical protein [Pontibacter burrus]